MPSSWNDSYLYEPSHSTQHLCVPLNSLRLHRFSEDNASLSVSKTTQKNSGSLNEQLIDPRLISNTVRRSLLALHRESQENLCTQASKGKTQSENDVHSSFVPWKMKMKSKLKRTPNNYQQHQTRSHAKTLSILPVRLCSNDQGRRISEYAVMNYDCRFSTPASYQSPTSPTYI